MHMKVLIQAFPGFVEAVQVARAQRLPAAEHGGTVDEKCWFWGTKPFPNVDPGTGRKQRNSTKETGLLLF